MNYRKKQKMNSITACRGEIRKEQLGIVLVNMKTGNDNG